MNPTDQNNLVEDYSFSKQEVALIAYITLMSKTIPSIYIHDYSRKGQTQPQPSNAVSVRFFHEARGTEAEFVMLPIMKRACLFTSDKEGLDPFWNPSFLRMTEICAMVESAGYLFENDIAPDHSEFDEYNKLYGTDPQTAPGDTGVAEH